MIGKILLLGLLVGSLSVATAKGFRDDELAAREKPAPLEQLQHHHQEQREKSATAAEPERAQLSRANNEQRKEEEEEPSKQTSGQKRDEPQAQTVQQVRDDNWWSGQQKEEEPAPTKSPVASKGEEAARTLWRTDGEPARASATAHSPPFRYFHYHQQQLGPAVHVPSLRQPPVVDVSLHYKPIGAYLGRPAQMGGPHSLVGGHAQAHFQRRAAIVYHHQQPHYLQPLYAPLAPRHEHHLAEDNQLTRYQAGGWLRSEGRLFE